MSVPYLVDLSTTKTATSKENYQSIYVDQFYIIAQGSLAFLVGFLAAQALGNIITVLAGDPKKNIIIFTLLCVFTIFIIALVASHFFATNKVKTESSKYILQ